MLPVVVLSLLNGLIPDGERRATLLSVESLVARGSYGGAALILGWALDVAPLSIVLLGVGALGAAPLALAALVLRVPPAPPTGAPRGNASR